MKKIIFILLVSLTSINANECEKIATIKIGDFFNTTIKEIIIEKANDEAKKYQSNKIEFDIKSKNHPKLGKGFYGLANIYKCK